MDTKIDFLYMSEQDTLDAGVFDAPRCINVCEEVFQLLTQGDYLMGGPEHNSHGMGLVFPPAEECKFPNMPVAGPDRRFVAMPAYLGGRFDVCGCKWYGSNAANTQRELPRSILTMMINDKDTGKPLCLMSANLLSAARTGAIPAVAVRHLANPDAEVAAIIGCGPINRACYRAIVTEAKNLKKTVCYDVFPEKAQAFADYCSKELGVPGVVCTDLAEALAQADIVSVAASRVKPLHLNREWIKKGATVLLTGPAKADDSLWQESRIVFDYIGLHNCYRSEAVTSGDIPGYYAGVIGGPIYALQDAGKLPKMEDSTDIGQVILGQKQGRVSHDDIMVFVACGMGVFDVAWSYDLYHTALQQGIGTKLNLWDEPYWK